eukprot:1451129-Alexandrium_andersonii.AAC.1
MSPPNSSGSTASTKKVPRRMPQPKCSAAAWLRSRASWNTQWQPEHQLAASSSGLLAPRQMEPTQLASMLP